MTQPLKNLTGDMSCCHKRLITCNPLLSAPTQLVLTTACPGPAAVHPHGCWATVYANTGNPTPGDIEKVFHLLWNESFTASFQGILEMQVLKGLALLDIVTQLLP